MADNVARRIALVAAVMSAACFPRPTSEAPGAARRSPSESLNTSDTRIVADLLEAADTRRGDTALVDVALASPTSFVRAFAARSVGQIGIRARAGALRSLVSDRDSMIAADAAFALGLMHDTVATTVLTSALTGPPAVVEAAAWSLGELGDGGRASLEAVLRSGEPRAALPQVLQASAKLRPVPVALIVPYVAHASVAIREAAVYALTRSRVPGAAAALLALDARLTGGRGEPGGGATEADVDLRSYLARGLARPFVGDSLAATALAALRRLVDDAHAHVRINAIRSLATYGPPARPELVRHLRDTDANARITVAQSLGGVIGASAREWSDAWAADTAFTFRRSLLSTAMKNGVRLAAIDPAAEQSWQRSPDWRYRVAAAEAAGAGSNAAVDSIAAPLIRDPDPRVRTAAYAAAIVWTDSIASATKPYGPAALRSALADSDLFVRATILGAIRSHARASDVPGALRAWRSAARDPENDARIAALRVIASAWSNDSSSFGTLRDSLLALSAPADPLEREVVRAVGPFRLWSHMGVTPRPRGWYDGQVRAFVSRERMGHTTRATITTVRGSVQIVLFGPEAPLTVANFVALARRGYYNDLTFHRVVPNFVAQDGDPRGDGSGGPGYAIRDELNRHWYDRGAVGMALSGPDTGGSQYFLTHSPQPHLDGHYTVFGHVTAGYDVLDALVQGDRIVSITIQ